MTMKKLLQSATLLAAISIIPLTNSPAAAQEEARDVLAAAVEDFIQPGYRSFADTAETMHALTEDFCAAPTQTGLDETREGFGDLVAAWSHIEIIRFGPVVDENRLERIFFFPDRRGIGLRQVQATLAKKDATALDPETLAIKSVALQGLTTLEYLLFGKGADKLATGDAFRCGFSQAVTARILATATELEAAWEDPKGIAMRLSDPQPGYRDYRTAREGLQALLSVFINSSELVADTRLKPFVGENAKKAHPKRAPLWRSGLTARSIEANIDGLQELYEASGIEKLVSTSTARFGQSAMFELDSATRTLNSLSGPLPDAAADPEQHGAVNYLLIVLHSVRDTFAGRIAVGLGLSAGFSSLDGD